MASLSSSIVITVSNEDDETSMKKNKKINNKDDKEIKMTNEKKTITQTSITSSLILHYLKNKLQYDHKKLIHSFKVGVALVLVSLLYLIDPLYEQVGENAMWAIMTVVVLFEFSAGATLGKGLNRGMGTILGGGLGSLAAILAQQLDYVIGAIVIGTTVFIFGAIGTYSRLIPNIKKKYDYGAMIFILTFNLVAVSGLQGEDVMKLARERLISIIVGFMVCVLTSLLVFPVWSSDELHSSIASKFDNLACSIEGCMEEYFKPIDEMGNQVKTSPDGYVSVLNSKAKDEIMGNFASWEPWHGKFGFYHPWDKYLQIGELLRDLAASLATLKGCVRSARQPSSVTLRLSIKEPCQTIATVLACSLRELGESIMQMKKCRQGELLIAKLKSASFKLGTVENGDGLAMASFVFLLVEMVDKVEMLAKEVEELGDVAGFLPQ